MSKHKRLCLPNSQFVYTKVAQKTRGMSPRAKAVLVALTGFVCRNGSAFPGHAALAVDSELSRRTVRRGIKDLEQMGLVRRVPTSRAFHGNSTNYYAVVLSVGQPSGQHVRAIGQHVRNSQDSVAALIRPLIKTKEEEGRWLVLSFEEYLLEVLHEVINFKRHPSLVCLGSVSRWLFNGHTSDQFEPALVHLLDEAERLNAELLAEGERLNTWSELIDRLKDSDELGAPDVTPCQLHPICEEIWELLPAPERNAFRSRQYLASIKVESDGANVTLGSRSKTAIDYLRSTCAAALSTLAQRHRHRFNIG